MMNVNTLYYTFSVIPQVTGAIAAIVWTVTHFRIGRLVDYLIGDGESVLKRWGEVGYALPDEVESTRQRKRLRDAIDRRSITEIKKVIFLLKENEIKEGYSREARPTGLQFVYEDRFCGAEKHMAKLKKSLFVVIIVSLISIVISIVSLAATDDIYNSSFCSFKYIILWLNVIIFVSAISSAFYLMCLCLQEKTVHEII